jgi:hypothetical protein
MGLTNKKIIKNARYKNCLEIVENNLIKQGYITIEDNFTNFINSVIKRYKKDEPYKELDEKSILFAILKNKKFTSEFENEYFKSDAKISIDKDIKLIIDNLQTENQSLKDISEGISDKLKGNPFFQEPESKEKEPNVNNNNWNPFLSNAQGESEPTNNIKRSKDKFDSEQIAGNNDKTSKR